MVLRYRIAAINGRVRALRTRVLRFWHEPVIKLPPVDQDL